MFSVGRQRRYFLAERARQAAGSLRIRHTTTVRLDATPPRAEIEALTKHARIGPTPAYPTPPALGQVALCLLAGRPTQHVTALAGVVAATEKLPGDGRQICPIRS